MSNMDLYVSVWQSIAECDLIRHGMKEHTRVVYAYIRVYISSFISQLVVTSSVLIIKYRFIQSIFSLLAYYFEHVYAMPMYFVIV